MHFPSECATAVIDTAALIKNFVTIQGRISQDTARSPALIAVVKANAYGHGFSLAVPAFLRAGCRFFAVANVQEALAVRRLAPEARILVLGYTPPTQAATLAEHNIEQAVFSLPYARALSEAASTVSRPISIHIKLNGGMCRLGFAPKRIQQMLAAAALPALSAVGLFTHFPCADSDEVATRRALSRFIACRDALQGKGLSLFCHTAASAAALTLPEAVLDGARVGLALYGIAPAKSALPLTPALSLYAPIVQIHHVPKGTPIGYGGDFITTRKTRIGTCPIGYADGISRAFSGGTVTVLRGQRQYAARVIGRICMDQLMLDLTDTPAKIGDRVLLFDDPRPMANALHTIPYEVLTAIGTRVLRKEKEVST